jgi:hypothetical protein
VKGVDFQHVKAQHAPDVPVIALTNVEDFSIHQCKGLPDTRLERVEQKKF